MKIPNVIHRNCGKLAVAMALMLMTAASGYADYQSVILGDNPVGYWPLSLYDANATNGIATDLSGNGNNAAYVNISPGFNNASGPTAYVTNGVSFNGSFTYADLSGAPNKLLLNFGGTITMEGWVQANDPGQSFGSIIAKGYDPANDNAEVYLWINSHQYQGGTYTGTTSIKGAYGGTVTTNWAYVVTTYDGTNWNTYVNAQLVAQGADSVGALNLTAPWAIGDGTLSGNTSILNGNLSQVALYTNALTPAQILNHYTEAEVNLPATVAKPIIVTQPQSQVSYVGGTVTFSVVAISGFGMTNQWFKGANPISGQTNSTLVLTNLALPDAGNYSVVAGNINGTTNSVVAVLAVNTPSNLKWTGAGGATWDTATTASWLNLSTSATTVFNSGDAVLFDDTPGIPTSITFSGLVAPSTMTVDSSVNNFSFGPYSPGNNTISGPVHLIKQGTSTLTLGTAGQFAGPVDIEAGVILAQGFSFQSVPVVTITNNSTLDLSGGNYVNLQQTMYISGTGVSGEAAIYNSTFNPSMAFNIVLTGDATIGAHTGNAWGMTGGSISGPHVLTLDWSTVNDYAEWDGPINIGADVVGIGITNGTLGLKFMTTACQNPNTVFTAGTNTTLVWWNGTGGFNGSLHILPTATALLWSAGSTYAGSNITLDGGCNWGSWGDAGDITIDSAVTLNGLVFCTIGDHNLVYTNVVSGSGGIVMYQYGNHGYVFQSANTYTGPTIINDGLQVSLTGNGSISHSSLIFFGGSDSTSAHIDVSGRPDQTLTLASGQTLGGVGTINGSLTVGAGAVISPAGTNTSIGITTGTNTTGTISATNAVALNGTTTLKLNGSGVNDQIQAGAGITYGGTLNLVNISGAPYAVGNSFQIFNAAGYTGSFANITPATPGTGLAWDTSQLNTFGSLNVVAAPAQPVINGTKISGGNLIFSGTGGTANAGYSVLTTTNLATPLASWMLLSTGNFDGSGAFSVTNAITPGSAQSFYMIRTP